MMGTESIYVNRNIFCNFEEILANDEYNNELPEYWHEEATRYRMYEFRDINNQISEII